MSSKERINSFKRSSQIPKQQENNSPDNGEKSSPRQKTKQDKKAEAEQEFIFSVLAATDYNFYLEYAHRGKYHHGAHTEYLADKLQELEKGNIKRLMVFMPPRHSKSMTISETFPSWFIGRKPARKVIVVSYGDSLARRFGRFNRKKIEDLGERIFGITLTRDSSTVTNWSVDAPEEGEGGGGMISAGVGGPISGEGADLLIIDDPIKNRQEADSPRYREMLWDEWQNTLLTRLQPNGSVIIVLTRWHEDDLAGRLLHEEGDAWEVISLPALAEENDLMGRNPGEALWPEFGFDEEWAAKKKPSVGSFVWASLFQQRPSPSGGGIFKPYWWRFWQYPKQDLPPVTLKSEEGNLIAVEPVNLPARFDQMAQSWDMAFKDTKQSSYVTGQVWARVSADEYLLDQVRDKMDFIQSIDALQVFTKKHPKARAKWIEDKANGPAIISSLRKKIAGLIPVNPQGSKEGRARAVSPYIESGNVFLPHPINAPWVLDFIEECKNFPSGKYNDQVDAMSQALLRMSPAGSGEDKNEAVADSYSKGVNTW